MYESHITVDNLPLTTFLNICKSINTKPVYIKEDTGSGVDQMMTAKFHKVESQEVALNQAKEIASHFPNVIRIKLEKIIKSNQPLPEHKYVEYHSKYEVEPHTSLAFQRVVKESGGHTAKNILKTTRFMFATARDKATYEKLKSVLNSYKLVNTTMECVVYDDNETLDNNWSCLECPIKRMV